MDKIKSKNGHYCLQLKKNQRAAYEGVELYYEDRMKSEKTKPDSYTQMSNDHGRIEKRTYYTVRSI